MLHPYRILGLFVTGLWLLSCSNVGNGPLDRDLFENTWWEFSLNEACFNVHESGKLLLRSKGEENETEVGNWKFEKPNSYIIDSDIGTVDVESNDEESSKEKYCWNIYIRSAMINDIVCTCTLF